MSLTSGLREEQNRDVSPCRSSLLTLLYAEDYYSKVRECKQCTWQQFFLVKLGLIGLHLHAVVQNRLVCRLSDCQPARLVAAVAHSGTTRQ